jgi:hypothetical protein
MRLNLRRGRSHEEGETWIFYRSVLVSLVIFDHSSIFEFEDPILLTEIDRFVQTQPFRSNVSVEKKMCLPPLFVVVMWT